MTVFIIAATGALSTAASAPFVRSLLVGKQILDVPNHRSSHVVPVPRGGGLACLIGILVAAATARWLGEEVNWLALGAAIALCAVGFVDDLVSLSPAPRLAIQVLVGALLGAASGGLWLAVLAAVLFPVIVNVVNFMDGINGISGAVLVVWGVAAVILGTSVGLGALTTLGAMSLGAALGFLPWNVPEARLFLGDSGSYLMGGIIAAGATISVPHDVPLVILLSPLALYVGDVALTLARRRHRGQPLLEAHKDHAYQRLVSVAGISHLKVASVVFVASALILSAWVLLPIALGLAVTVVVTGAFLGLPHLAESRS